MKISREWWVSRLVLVSVAALLTGCAGLPLMPTAMPATAATTPPPPKAGTPSDDDDFSQLIAQLKGDLNRFNNREIARKPTIAPTAQTSRTRDREFAERARALFAPLNGSALHMPVVGVRPFDLDDSWHAPRDGGSRLHKGIDIFAPRGTAVVAVADGFISFIGDQPKGGHCIWLTTESGSSFYYAHLDRWAPGLYEGMEVQSGDLLGFVGTTGNASRTPPHLHFAVNLNDEMVNPYPLLSRAAQVARARVPVELGGGFGTR